MLIDFFPRPLVSFIFIFLVHISNGPPAGKTHFTSFKYRACINRHCAGPFPGAAFSLSFFFLLLPRRQNIYTQRKRERRARGRTTMTHEKAVAGRCLLKHELYLSIKRLIMHSTIQMEPPSRKESLLVFDRICSIVLCSSVLHLSFQWVVKPNSQLSRLFKRNK